MANILIDGFNLGLEKGTGVATYARNLSYELKALGHDVTVLYGNQSGTPRDNLLSEIAFFDSSGRTTHKALEIAGHFYHNILGWWGETARKVPISGKVVSRTFDARMPAYDTILNSNDIFNRANVAFQLWNSMSTVWAPTRPDIAHWTYPIPVRIKGAPNIYTLHDVVPLRLPYTTLDKKKNYLQLMRELSRKADHLVTVSECSRRDLIEVLGISPNRITNTYQSVSVPSKYTNKPEEQVAREVEGVAGVGYKDYYLFWGSIEPKKNIGRMIEAYLASKVESPLVIVGARAWKSEDELRLLNEEIIRSLKITDGQITTRKRVIQLSYAPFSLLVSLIRGAKAALFPSLYEGFGLPALEAMLLGTPVICSNTASLPEVVGDAALMIDPYDSAALAEAIRTVDADDGLRDEYSQRGLAQAEIYSPENYRERLKDLYQNFV